MGNNNEGITFTIDPDALNCPVCFEKLSPPIFQCYYGHIACSSCCTRLKSCPSCSCLIGLRCLGLEKVIQSVKVSCPYTSLGCQEMVSYADRHAHAETCIYSPCHCSIDECTFKGTKEGKKNLNSETKKKSNADAGLPSRDQVSV